VKALIRSFLFFLRIGILKRYSLDVYNSIYSKSNYGFSIPFSDLVLVSKSTAKNINDILYENFSPESLPSKADLPCTPVLNWRPGKDEARIVLSAQKYREELSKNQYAAAFRNKMVGNISISNNRGYWRVETMNQLRMSLPGIFKGKVLEIGAGTGLVSSMLSKFEEVDEVFSLDYDAHTVENLMPLVQWSLGANTNKMHRVIGSYNNLECKDGEFDTIVAVGAMHHSEDIDATMRECYRALRAGGKFIISDYALTGSLTQEESSVMMAKPLSEDGAVILAAGGDVKKIRTNKTISEHARPAYIYQAAAFNAGFNVTINIFDATLDNGGRLTRLWRRVRDSAKTENFYSLNSGGRELGYDNFGNVRAFTMSEKVRYPVYAYGAPTPLKLFLFHDFLAKPLYDNMVLVLEKPCGDNKKISYRYPSGKVYEFPVVRPDK